MFFLYFDTSDISGFADLKDASIETIYKIIISKAESKKFCAPVSIYHISECSHVDPVYRDAGLRRAAVLKRLSCGLAFPYPPDLLVTEWLTLLRTVKVATRDDIISSRGQWYPSSAFRSSSVRVDFRETVNKELRKLPINRLKRRAILTHFLSRVYLKQVFIEQYPEAFANAVAVCNEQAPFTNSSFMSKFLRGQIPEDAVVRHLEDEGFTWVTLGLADGHKRA